MSEQGSTTSAVSSEAFAGSGGHALDTLNFPRQPPGPSVSVVEWWRPGPSRSWVEYPPKVLAMIPRTSPAPPPNTPVAFALAYAKAGLRVFPAGGQKKPLIGKGGFHLATTDQDQIRAWWTKWPYADVGAAVPDGVAILDFDCAKGKNGRAAYQRLENVDPETIEAPMATTPSGGLHVWTSTNGRRLKQATGYEAQGIDVRLGGRGYVVLPGANNGRQWRKPMSTSLPPTPTWVKDEIEPQPSQATTGETTAYGRAALNNACAKISAAGPGERDAAIGSVTLKIGSLVGGGEIDEAQALDRLLDAVIFNGGDFTEQKDKIERALKDGRSHPRSAPNKQAKAQPPPDGLDATSNGEGVQLEDFVAYMQTNDYIFKPAGDFWPTARVNARLPKIKLFDGNGQPVMDENTGEQKEIRPSDWLAKHGPVEQMTWAPGLPQIIKDKLINTGGWINRKGVSVFNLYRPPRPSYGDAAKADPWLAHVKNIYPDDAGHIIMFLAHRVQKPNEKINHGLLLIGVPGIGKDTMLEPIKHGVGAWNFAEVSPPQVLGRFNGFLKSVVLRISEVTDMPEFDRYKFYSHLKTILAAPPDALRVDEKNLREHYVVNVCGVIMLTNEKTGVYLPADDRRHYVAKSEVKQTDFPEGYRTKLWRWYEDGGFWHVVAYLTELDISGFDPKAPPRKTTAFWTIVDANRAPENLELADAIDEIARRNAQKPLEDDEPVKITDKPTALSIAKIVSMMGSESTLGQWLCDIKNRRVIPHRFEQCGYVQVRNDDADDGLFVIRRRRQVVYGRCDLTIGDRLAAARKFVSDENK
jgi:hypothetical protein